MHIKLLLVLKSVGNVCRKSFWSKCFHFGHFFFSTQATCDQNSVDGFATYFFSNFVSENQVVQDDLGRIVLPRDWIQFLGCCQIS